MAVEPTDEQQVLLVSDDRPLVALFIERDGQEFTCYFVDEGFDAPTSSEDMQDALAAIGAWSDLDWDEVEAELDRIRHESKPTPPIELDW